MRYELIKIGVVIAVTVTMILIGYKVYNNALKMVEKQAGQLERALKW